MVLNFTEHVKYLGVYMDKHLSWDFHINQLCNRANGVLLELRQFCPTAVLKSVYYSLFYSHLIYGCPIWSLTAKKKNLDLVIPLQKQCI